MSKPRVFVRGRDAAYERMFHEQGDFEVVGREEDADVIQFTGGEDVSPNMYNCSPHPSTRYNPDRDFLEQNLFHRSEDKVKLGICRGAQFLWVMHRGELFQDVTDHCGRHWVLEVDKGIRVWVSSTHHQMMKISDTPMDTFRVLALAGHCRHKEYIQAAGTDSPGKLCKMPGGDGMDLEAVVFSSTRTLCYQPHPEFADDGCRTLYFYLIHRQFPELFTTEEK